jgi:hypothetical protein
LLLCALFGALHIVADILNVSGLVPSAGMMPDLNDHTGFPIMPTGQPMTMWIPSSVKQ